MLRPPRSARARPSASAPLRSRSVTQLAGLTGAAVRGLTFDQIALLTTTKLDALTATQIAALSTGAIRGLGDDQIASLTTTQIGSLTAAQLAVFDAEVVA